MDEAEQRLLAMSQKYGTFEVGTPVDSDLATAAIKERMTKHPGWIARDCSVGADGITRQWFQFYEELASKVKL